MKNVETYNQNKNLKLETVANDELSESARKDIIKSLISKRTENVDKINEYITSFVEKLRFQYCEDFNILKEIKNFLYVIAAVVGKA